MFSRLRKILNFSTRSSLPGGWWPSALSSSGFLGGEQALLAPTMFACVDFIARTIAGTPIIVYKIDSDGDMVPDVKHPLYTLLRYQPNAWQTAFDFDIARVTDLCTSGFFAAKKVLNSSGKLSSLILFDPASVTMTQNLDGRITFSGNLRMGSNSVRRVENVPQAEVHYCPYRTLDGVTPVSPIRYAAESIKYERNILTHGLTFLQNDAVPPMVVSWPKNLTEKSLKAAMDQWKDTSTGANYGKPKFLDQDAKVTKLDMANEDAMYLDARKFNARAICSIFGVPPRMIGIENESKGWQTIGQEGQDFLRFNLRPWLERIIQAITRDFIPEADRQRVIVDFDTSHIDMPDMDTYTKFMRAAMNFGVLSPNDVRKKMRMNKRPGGDVYMYPQNMAKETAV